MILQRFGEFRIGRGEVLFLAPAISCRVVPFRNVQRRDLCDLGPGFVFAATRNSWSAAVVLDQRLRGGKISFVQPHCGLEFLARFLCQREPRKHSGVLGFAAIRPAEPFVVHGILRVELNGFFRTGDRGVVLLHFVVSLRQQQVDFGISRIFRPGILQLSRSIGIVAGFVCLPAGLKSFVLLQIR